MFNCKRPLILLLGLISSCSSLEKSNTPKRAQDHELREVVEEKLATYLKKTQWE